jgi:hypothetical protein
MYKSNPERYKFAEQLYCFTDKDIPEIAELTKIPVRTLYQRARDYKWARLRRASRRSPAILCEEMYRELADLTELINSRPEGQRIPTQQEANLRKKILSSIADIKRYPTHAEAVFILESLIRYANHFHFDRLDGLQYLVECFLAHRDVYGFASYQPEHNQDLNHLNEQDMEHAFEEQENPPYRLPDETTIALNKDLPVCIVPEPKQLPDIITKFKTHQPSASGGQSATGAAFSS